MMRRLRSMCLALFSLVLLLGSGCGMFETVGPNDIYYRSNVLVAGRILIGGHLTEEPEQDLGLYTLYVPSTNSTRYGYRRGDNDYFGPTITVDTNGHYHIIYGFDKLTFMHTVLLEFTDVTGVGTYQMAPAIDPSPSNKMRFAYMDGSDTDGYDIIVQTGPEGTPTMITDDASSSVSYWTPSFSQGGTWVLFAKVTGTTGADAQLWRAHPDGSGAEQLPITTTELPTYAVFKPDSSEVFVPGDFTSYKIADGSVGVFDHVREQAAFLSDLSAMGYEFVGSPITGPTHPGEETSPVRHTFPISCMWWPNQSGDRIFFDALVASNVGTPPHEVLGIVVFSWAPYSAILKAHTPPMKIGSDRTKGYMLSPAHPTMVLPLPSPIAPPPR
jgi:hypothetical protein